MNPLVRALMIQLLLQILTSECCSGDQAFTDGPSRDISDPNHSTHDRLIYSSLVPELSNAGTWMLLTQFSYFSPENPCESSLEMAR